MAEPSDPIPSALAAAREAREKAEKARRVIQLLRDERILQDLEMLCLQAHIEAMAQRCTELEANLAKADYVINFFGGNFIEGYRTEENYELHRQACLRHYARRASAPGEKDKTP